MPEKLKILVVDDNKDFCQNITDILELKGWETSSANDGFEALDMVGQNGFDLVLMDIKMPAMNGVETFKKIKSIAPQTPVIMVTAFAVEELIRDALREGAFGFLSKPLNFNKLFTLIEQAIPNGALILVVDDDETLCVNIKEILIKKGYRVELAHDGDAALEKVRTHNFDIILLDLKLPPLNGLETYLAIRDLRPNGITVIITGYMQEMNNLVQQAIEGNAYTCLQKPLDMDKLIPLLEQIQKQKARGKLEKPE